MKKIHFMMAVLMAFTMGTTITACSDDSDKKSSHTEEPADPEEPQKADPEEPPKEEPEEPKKEDPEDTPKAYEAILMPNISTDVEVANEGSSKLSVILVSTIGDDAGEGIAAQKIQWGVESGSESISLAVKKSVTNEAGIATATINATDIPGEAVVLASSDMAPKAVRFNVKVLDIPTGALNATAKYNGVAPVKNYSIKLYDGSEVQCGRIDVKSGSILNWKTEAEAEPLYPAVDGQTAKFENLSLEKDYTVIAYGYSEAGAPVAAGCLDSGTDVFANQTTDVTVYLDTIDLDPVTTYHVRSYMDLGDVVSSLGQVGKYLSLVGDFAANPGKKTYELILDEVVGGIFGNWGSWALDTLFSVFGLKDKLLSYINEQIKSNQSTCKIGLFACQFRSIIRTMEFLGTLDIQKEGSIELSGHNTYDGLAVYWRVNCTDSTDPNCGRHALSTNSITTEDNIHLLEGSWSGSLANGYDKLSIESHSLKLEYGKIIVMLLNDFILPRVTEHECNSSDNDANRTDDPNVCVCHDMTCALGYWINSDAISQWLAEMISKVKTVSKDDVKTYVDKAVSGLASILNFASAYAQMQSAGSDIEISGTALMHDTNADNVVDIIDTGKWSGSMSITSKSDGTETKTTTAVKGIWSAYNAKNVKIDDENIYCTQDKTETDSDKGQLCHYPELDIESLSDSGMCKDYAKCAN